MTATKQLPKQYAWIPTAGLVVIVGYMLWVTGQHQQHRDRVQHERDLILKTLSNTIQPRMAVDESLRICAANDTCATLTGYSVEELVGMNAHAIIPPKYHADHSLGLAKHLQEPNEIHAIECELKTKTGELVPVRLNLTSMELDGRRMFAVKYRKLNELEIVKGGIK